MPPERPKQGLAIGEQAPDFALPAIDGQTVSLSDYRGRQPLLLVFYRGWW